MRYCSKCDKNKEDNCFNDGQKWCKNCHSEYNKRWRQNKKEDIKLYKRQYDIDNSDHNAIYLREYRENNKELVAINRRQYVKNKRADDPAYRLNQILSSIINKTLKKSGSSKNGESKSMYLSYSFQELKHHLESQFESWMNWNNQGVYDHKMWDDDDPSTWTWNIDHIIPRADLPYTSMKDNNFKKCWALTNLRPLSSKINVIEGAKKVRHRRKS